MKANKANKATVLSNEERQRRSSSRPTNSDPEVQAMVKFKGGSASFFKLHGNDVKTTTSPTTVAAVTSLENKEEVKAKDFDSTNYLENFPALS
jgi:hypothetical protein